ncbi:acyl carrier protein [Thermomonospora echinospora]|uniref:Acyl carrier protein n=1 Tax=Thermomonospora echinospora TaxID=1992 RepID=A0A1H5VFR3_9ACTN|nr:acyl carrier protein [Thermomonospora echinospora]SEF86192.1 acyl carrier protein [Thermomonospora echinospora]
MSQTMTDRMGELREIVADVLEVEPEEITDDGLFTEDHDADSLQAIDVLARIEKTYKVDIPQSELPNMNTLQDVYKVVASYAGWRD